MYRTGAAAEERRVDFQTLAAQYTIHIISLCRGSRVWSLPTKCTRRSRGAVGCKHRKFVQTSNLDLKINKQPQYHSLTLRDTRVILVNRKKHWSNTTRKRPDLVPGIQRDNSGRASKPFLPLTPVASRIARPLRVKRRAAERNTIMTDP